MIGHVFCSIGIYVDTVNFMTYVNTVNNVDSEYFSMKKTAASMPMSSGRASMLPR